MRVDDPRLSRHHARLLNDGSSLIIEDLGSTNGVLVNGELITGKKHLMSGDTVVCGPCVFTVALDPTQKASASELLPSTDRHPDQRDTDAMDPLNLPGSDWVAAAKPRQPPPQRVEVSPAPAEPRKIKTDAFASDVSSDSLKPNEELKTGTAALIHRDDTTPRGNLIPSPSNTTHERPSQAHKKPKKNNKDHTTGLIPADFKQSNIATLQPDFLTAAPSGPAPAGKRLIAGLADGVTALLLMMMLSLPLILGGYAWALAQAGVVIEQGLPQLSAHPDRTNTSSSAVIGSLLRSGGLTRANELKSRLMRADDQQPFLTLFASTALGVLLAVVGASIYLIGSTVVRGAPYWHRTCGLEVLEHRTGYQLTWGRATFRWLIFALLWPLASLTLALDQRALHDRITGCAVRRKRR